jgi:hypothetical protein
MASARGPNAWARLIDSFKCIYLLMTCTAREFNRSSHSTTAAACGH